MSYENPSVTDWGSFHHLCFNLSHAASDVVRMGWVHDETDHNNYMTCIKWCNSYIEDELVSTELATETKFDKEDLTELLSVPSGEISCLEQDIFIALFALTELRNIFKLEESDRKILDPVEKHILSLIPWVKWED